MPPAYSFVDLTTSGYPICGKSPPCRSAPAGSGRIVAIYRPILQWGPPLDEGLGVRWTGLHFFFSFELSYLKAAKKSSLAGVPELGTKTSCLPHFHCAIWSCVVFSDSPRHRIESGRHWPVKSPTRRVSPERPPAAAIGFVEGVIYEYR